MVDELISDPDLENLKHQADNKRLDHIYRYYGLLDNVNKEDDNKVYYIGDSKYYPRGSQLGKESVAKQFTYARNLVQDNLNLLFDGQKHQQYRDERTEGYDIIPNFFISAQVPDLSKDGYGKRELTPIKAKDGKCFEISYHFKNRLFDRDTILVARYDVNFLFILSLYARNNNNEKSKWKDEVRKIFQTQIRRDLQEEYEFFAMKPRIKGADETYFHDNFQKILGKVYAPYGDEPIYSLALDKNDSDGTKKDMLEELKKVFFVEPCELGTSPAKALEKHSTIALGPTSADLLAIVVNDNDCDATAKKINVQKKYGIGLGDSSGALALSESYTKVRYLILHKLKDPVVFKLKTGPHLLTKAQVNECGIPIKMKDSEIFISWDVENEDSDLENKVDVNRLRNDKDYTIRQSRVVNISDILLL